MVWSCSSVAPWATCKPIKWGLKLLYYNYSIFLFSFVAHIDFVYDHSNLNRLIVILSATCSLFFGIKAIDRYSLNYFRTIFSGESRPSDRAGGGRSSRPWDKAGWGGLQKHFSALRASVLAKNKGGGVAGPTGPFPGSDTDINN